MAELLIHIQQEMYKLSLWSFEKNIAIGILKISSQLTEFNFGVTILYLTGGTVPTREGKFWCGKSEVFNLTLSGQ